MERPGFPINNALFVDVSEFSITHGDMSSNGEGSIESDFESESAGEANISGMDSLIAGAGGQVQFGLVGRRVPTPALIEPTTDNHDEASNVPSSVSIQTFSNSILVYLKYV